MVQKLILNSRLDQAEQVLEYGQHFLKFKSNFSHPTLVFLLMKTEGQLKSCKNDMEGALRVIKQAVRLAHANP